MLQILKISKKYQSTLRLNKIRLFEVKTIDSAIEKKSSINSGNEVRIIQETNTLEASVGVGNYIGALRDQSLQAS